MLVVLYITSQERFRAKLSVFEIFSLSFKLA